MLKIDIKKYKKYAFVFLGIIGIVSLGTIIFLNSLMKGIPEKPALFDSSSPVKMVESAKTKEERKIPEEDHAMVNDKKMEDKKPEKVIIKGAQQETPAQKIYDIFRKEDIEKQERKEKISRAEDDAKLEAIMTEIKKKKKEGELTEIEAKVKKGTLESSLSRSQSAIAPPGFEIKEKNREPILEVSGIINTGDRMTAIAVYGGRRYNILEGSQIGAYKVKKIFPEYVLIEKEGKEEKILPSASVITPTQEQRPTQQRTLPPSPQPFPFPLDRPFAPGQKG